MTSSLIDEIQQHLDNMRKHILKDEKHSYLVIPDENKRNKVLADIALINMHFMELQSRLKY